MCRPHAIATTAATAAAVNFPKLIYKITKIDLLSLKRKQQQNIARMWSGTATETRRREIYMPSIEISNTNIGDYEHTTFIESVESIF